MSWRIANECAERRFGSAARKQIIMFLADKASDDGSGIWCSKGTIQRHTELSESTVKRTDHRLPAGRHLDRDRAAALQERLHRHLPHRSRTRGGAGTHAEPDIETGVTVNPVQPEPGTGSTVAGVRGSPWTPNHPKTIHKPPTRRREAAGRLKILNLRRSWRPFPRTGSETGEPVCV